MSSLEKLYKNLESSGFIKKQNKKFVETNILERNTKLKKFSKQDKLRHCTAIGEGIYQLGPKDECDIQGLIKICMEAFFIFCNDAEQDVRTNANECLNKLINSKFIEHSPRIQNELVKELKNDAHSFSVVAALSRLTAISHLMRPSRSKLFFVSLMPCLVKLSERTEDELVQECLNEHIDVLMQRFIKFGSEGDVTSLLNAFIRNLYLENKSAKRTAANCLLAICENSKKKFDMVYWLLNELFKQLTECDAGQRNSYLIGTFLCLKTIKPLLQDYRFQNEQDVNLDLSLNFEDKEIISVQANTIKQNLLLFYLVFLNELQSNEDSQVINILLEFLQVLLKSPAKVFQSLWIQRVADKFAAIADEEFDEDKKKAIYDEFFGNLNGPDAADSESDTSTFLEHTLKVICVKFLLRDDPTSRLKSDEEVRVLMKSLALNCVAKLIEHQPDCLRLVVFEQNDVRVVDVLQYAKHPDSNLTGQSSLIAGSFIRSKLTLHSFNSQNLSEEDERLILELFFRHLYAALENKSSVHLKLVLTAIKNCINELLNSNSILNLVVIDLLRKLVTFSTHPYWLIKVELLEIFSLLNYSQICFIERNLSTKFAIDSSSIQVLILNSVFYNLLVDNDHRVRSATIKNLIKLIPKFYFANHNDSRCDEILALAKNSNFTNSSQHARSYSFNLNSEQYKKINIFPDNHLLPHSFGFVFPFSESRAADRSSSANSIPTNELADVEFNLKTIISHLISNLLEKLDDKLTLTGILEALAELTDAYPTTKFIESWNISKSIKLVEFLYSYLTTTQNAILDLSLHTLFLRLITNLVCGCAYNELKENSVFRAKSRNSIFERSFQSESLNRSSKLIDGEQAETESMASYRTDAYQSPNSSFINSVASHEQNWGRLGTLNPDLKSILRRLTVHFTRLLHVYSTVFSESQTETSRSFLTQVFKPNFSPLKRTNSSDLFKKFSENKERQNSANKKEAQYLSAHLYTNDSNLVKLHEAIRKMYLSTMNTLDFLHTEPVKQNKLIQFLDEILGSFSKLLELGHHNYFGRLTDELVQLILPIFTVQSASCIQFVKQLVKVLFGANFASIYEFEYPTLFDAADPSELEHLSYSSFLNEASFDQCGGGGAQTNAAGLSNDLHAICLLSNYERFKDRLSCLNESSGSGHPTTGSKASRCELEKEYYNVFYRKLFDKRVKSVLSQNYSEFINEPLITNCLQIVQPLLVDSMKNYTCRSDLALHCSTLNLLNELVKVRISYAHLDKNQTFFTFLHKQFEFIENEQISSDQLVESIFGFLITLSYDKSSYALMTYPKIIQAMGNLQASDANFELNVYPALSLIVEDLFLIRTISNSEDLKELETQKEFIINLLIKSSHLPKIIYLLNIILIEYKLEGEEKVKKLSRQITDQLLQNLAKGYVNFSDIEDVNIIMKLFLSVNPVVFRPVDFVLNGIFSLFDDDLLNNQTSFLKFFSHKLILFNVLVGNSKEDIILNRLDDLKANLANLAIQAKTARPNGDGGGQLFALPVFCRIRNADKSISLDSKQIITDYLIKLVRLALERLVDCDRMLCNEENLKFREFLSQLLNQLLMNILYIVREGQFPKIRKCLENGLQENDCCLPRINRLIKALSISCPILVLQWLNILVELDLIDKANPAGLYEELQQDELASVRAKFERILAGSSLLTGDSDSALGLNKNSFLSRIIKKNPLVKLSQIDRHLYSPQLELIRRNKYLISFNHLTESSNYLKEEQWLNERNVLFFILHSRQQSIGKIFELISLDADLSSKFIDVLGRIDLDLDRLTDLNNQRIPILTVERLLVFCSNLHEKSNRPLIEFVLNNLYSNPKFIYTVALRKTMLQIVNQKLKSFSFIRNGKDERLSREQITIFIRNLQESNSCGLKHCLNETVAYLNDYLNALDLSIGDDSENNSESELFDAFENNYAGTKSDDQSAIKEPPNDAGAHLSKPAEVIKPEKSESDPSKTNSDDCVDRERANCANVLGDLQPVNENSPKESLKESDPPSSDTQTSTYHSLTGSEEKPDESPTSPTTTCPNQGWLIDVLLNKPTFNKSADLFTVLNSNFSVHELVAMLEDRRFTQHSRQIEFATNALDHVNGMLEESLDCSRSSSAHSSASSCGQFLKTSKFSLVLAVRQVFVRICDRLFAELNLPLNSTYFAYLNREELLFEEEIASFNRITTLFSNKSNRRKLIKLSSLLCRMLEHLDLIMRFDQVRKRCLLNQQQELTLRNDEHIEKLIKLDRLDFDRLLRTLMLYCELMQFEISTGDENYVNDCLLIVRSFVRSDLLMNILAAYQHNAMQFTLIAALYSFYRKRFDLFSTMNCSLTKRNSIPKHFQNNPPGTGPHDPPDEQRLKYKHCHNACLKVGEIIDFILKQSNELTCKDNHLLQNRKLFSALDLDNLVYITLVLGRLPLVNSFILVPCEIWKNDWQPNFVSLKQTGEEKRAGGAVKQFYEADTFCATLPSEQLFDSDTLQTFINLINLVGFTKRIQFEEIWMSLLGVISLNLNDLGDGKQSNNEELFIEEANEKANLIVLAIKGITSIILQCGFTEIGFPVKSLKQRLHRVADSGNDDYTRKKDFLTTKYGAKLLHLNKHLDPATNIRFAGLAKDINESYFESLMLGDLNYNYLNLVQFTEHFYENRYGLYSTEYLKKKFGLIKNPGESLSMNESSSSSSSSSTPVHQQQLSRSDSLISPNNKEEIFIKVYKNKESNNTVAPHNRLEIDVNSCIQLLLDFYGTMFKSHIAVQEEVLKSLIKISDLFFDLQQFNRNIEQFFDLFKTAFSQEDEILIQYLILGICKFYTVTHETMNDNITLEKVKKCVEISLKSQFFPTRVNCLVGLNYLLQDKLNAINRARPSASKDAAIFAMLKDYVLKWLFEPDLNKNVEHAVLVWNSAFLLVDYGAEEFDESDFNQKLFRQTLIVLSACENVQIYTVVANGVQRLLVSDFFRIRECNKIVKICTDKLMRKALYDFQTISSFHILVTSIYAFGLLPNGEQANPDEEISSLNLENINILFSCLKKLDCNQSYYELIANCLPDISIDFIPDGPDGKLLNKVINEFLVNQNNNNVEFFAVIMHKVITKLQRHSKQTSVHDWVCLSIKNFTQIKPLECAISSVFALLVSASNNSYIRSLFESIVRHYGKLDDRELLRTVAQNYMEELNPENIKLLSIAVNDLDKMMEIASLDD